MNKPKTSLEVGMEYHQINDANYCYDCVKEGIISALADQKAKIQKLIESYNDGCLEVEHLLKEFKELM